ncbi:helix-turn-helix domain-containing protein (plasmid) [Acetobacteraceae bacterium]|nr:helix-turn-helix domain-containing protein [Acetobacteraceae bacterium]
MNWQRNIKMTLEFKTFNASEFLTTEEDRKGFVKAMLDTSRKIGTDPVESLKIALADIAESRGFSKKKISEETQISRVTISKFFKPGTKPRAETLFAIAKALDVSFVPV